MLLSDRAGFWFATGDPGNGADENNIIAAAAIASAMLVLFLPSF